jgi:hypothetical protein
MPVIIDGTLGVTTPGLINANGNGVGNIGSSANQWNVVFARANSAQYADLAEKYAADRHYEPGTVLEIGGEKEVTETTTFASTKLIGVVSTNPAVIMNSGENSEFSTEVALTGRVPCKVIGKIAKGDLMCSSDVPGVATALPADKYNPGCVVGKALENYNGDGQGIIEVLVGRL